MLKRLTRKKKLVIGAILATFLGISFILAWISSFLPYDKGPDPLEYTVTVMERIRQELRYFKQACNVYPTTAQGLEALVHAPSEIKCRFGLNKVTLIDFNGYGQLPIYESDGKTFTLRYLPEDPSKSKRGPPFEIFATDSEAPHDQLGKMLSL